MDYKKIIIPFLDNQTIKDKADKFRKELGNSCLPVNIEDIIEIKLGIDIIPYPGLQILCDTDALISSDWKSIVVDYNKFSDERYLNRLRFSFAHEIGHFILHKNIYKDLKIKNINDFQKFIKEIPIKQYGYLETQANKFANFLLIPREDMKTERSKEIKKNPELNSLINSGKIKEVNSYLAIPISKIFGVSEDAMEIALNEN